MNKEEQMICSHLLDLAEACDRRGYPMGSDFLTLNEQNLFLAFSKDKLPPVSMEMCGGYELAERKIIFYKPVGVGEEYPAPISLLSVQPLMKKFSEELTHRDYLGALMHLGIERSCLGDILVQGHTAYVFCLEKMAELICREVTRIRHTTVMAVKETLSEIPSPRIQDVTGTVSSVRLDSVLAVAFGLSRNKAIPYIEGGQVYVNARQVVSNGYGLHPGDLISVRGLGKFRYVDVRNQSKKGKYWIDIQKFV